MGQILIREDGGVDSNVDQVDGDGRNFGQDSTAQGICQCKRTRLEDEVDTILIDLVQVRWMWTEGRQIVGKAHFSHGDLGTGGFDTIHPIVAVAVIAIVSHNDCINSPQGTGGILIQEEEAGGFAVDRNVENIAGEAATTRATVTLFLARAPLLVM